MTAAAGTIQLFFTERLISEQGASPATITAYRDTIRLLLCHAAAQTGRPAAALDFSQLDAAMIGRFLQHLETGRGNSIRTRNARLAAIRSLFTYAARRHPEHAGDIARVLAIGPKRAAHAVVTYLSDPELTAVIAACDTGTVTGRRDRVMIHLAAQTGLRAAELLALTPADLHLDHGAHVSCRGKGRKNRITPLTPDTTGLLRTHQSDQCGSYRARVQCRVCIGRAGPSLRFGHTRPVRSRRVPCGKCWRSSRGPPSRRSGCSLS